jgi:hypothetical protein
MESTTTRRAQLKATTATAAPLASSPASSGAATTAADDDHYTREEYEAGRKSAEEIAYLWVARAWLDRWKALGGNVGLTYDGDLNPIGVHRGMVADPDFWTHRTDEGRDDIPPHVWLYRDGHHEGAYKALEGLLVMVPGLKDAVSEIAGREAMTCWAQGREV